MKKIIYVLSIFAFSQGFSQNRSKSGVIATANLLTPIPNAVSTIPLGIPVGAETFRFGQGLVTQLDAGTNYGFGTNKQWFSIGRLTVGPAAPAPASSRRTLYGFRLQSAGQGLTMGYGGAEQPTVPINTDFAGSLSAQRNPFIEWIGNDGVSVGAGDFQFFTATNPGGPPPAGAAVRRLSFTLRSDLTALFGETSNFTDPSNQFFTRPKVEVNSIAGQSLFAKSLNSTNTATFINDGGGDSGEGFFEFDPVTGLGTLIQIIEANSLKASANSSGNNLGILSFADGGSQNIGINSNATRGTRSVNSFNVGILSNANGFGAKSNNYGVFSSANGSVTGSINCGVYASATGNVVPLTPGVAETIGTYAGYFAGLLYSSSSFTVSDKNLKKNIIPETSNFEKLSKLNPVTYNYIANKDGLKLNLPTELQHGLVAQELEKVYPELVKDLLHPLFDEKNKQIGTKSFKAVNYNGLISIMISSMNEMSSKILKLEETLALKEKTIVVNSNKNFTKSEIESIETNGYFLGQNNPNPFKNSTIIEYSLPVNEKNASILIFNLNGQTLKEYKLLETKGSISIDSTTLSKGLYLYSLIVNGQEIATKKMLMN